MDVKKKYSIKTIIWILLLIIFCFQLFVIVQLHSILGHLTIWDTILLLIIRLDVSPFIGKWLCKQESRIQRPFLHIIGCIAVVALLFVSFIHALKTVFYEEFTSRLTIQFLVVTLINLVLKLSIVCEFQIELLKLGHQFILHLLMPAVLFIFYYFDNGYYFVQLDSWLSMIFCFFLTIIVLPIIFYYIPFLLCNNPTGFQIERFKNEFETKFSRTKCLHLHVLRTYSNRFDVIMHISIDITASPAYLNKNYQKNNKNELIQFGNKTEFDVTSKINEITNQLQCVLMKAGAQSVTIQPHINGAINSDGVEFFNYVWKSCITDKCSENNGCCTNQLNK